MPQGIRLLAVTGTVLLLLCQWLIYIYAPVEAVMGIVQKIFYIHLPLAWWSFASFFVVFVASIAFLRTKAARWDRLAGAAAEVGVLCSTLALLSGSLWARHSWGVWWTWDPRLTTTLIMWFVYTAYLVLRTLDISEARRGRICAVVGIVAFIDVPLVFISARLWRSIHPAVFASRGGGLDDAMKITVISCVLAFGFIWAAMLLLRKAQLDAKARLDALRVQEGDYDD